MSKITQRQRQAINTKLKITSKAAELFTQKGFGEVTVRDICAASDISIGTFYHHFESKDEIVNTGYHELDLLWEERIEGYESQGSKEDIKFLFKEAGAVSQNVGWVLSSQSYRHLLSSKSKYPLQTDRSIYKYLQDIIETGQGKDINLKDRDIHKFMESLMRCSRGVIYDWCLHEGSYDLEEQIGEDIALILNNY